jgi:cell division protein ZapA
MTTEVQIFGAKYTFDSDDPEHVRQLAEFVNRKMLEAAANIKNVTTSKVAVLVAMNLAEELLNLRNTVERSSRLAIDRLDKLVNVAQNLASPPQVEQ